MSLKKNIAASWAAHVVTLLVGFCLVPFILHSIGEEGYGVWVFVNSLAGYSGVLYLGFGPTVCRYVAKHRAKGEWDAINQVVSSVVAVYVAAGGVVLLLAAGLVGGAAYLDKWDSTPLLDVQCAVLILGLNMAAGMVGSVYGGVLHASQRFDLVSSVYGLMALVRFGLTIGFLQQRHGLVILAGIFLLVTLLENALMAALAYREVCTLSIGRRWMSRAVLKECFRFSAFTALRFVSVRLIYMTDTVVIGFVLGAKAIVPYYIGSRLVQMIHEPLEKISEVVLPSAGALHARDEHERLQELLAKAMGLTFALAGGFWIGAAYFGEWLLTTWMGETFAESRTVLLILLAAQVVAQPLFVVRQVLLAMGRVRLQALLDLLQAFANLALSLLLIRVMGIIGVAWGTLIPMVLVELGLLLPYGLRVLDLRIRPLLWNVCAPNLLPLATLWLYCEVVSTMSLPGGWTGVLSVTIGGGAVLGLTRLMLEYADRWLARAQSEAAAATEAAA
jgi:O-antigen/teichoic acid export membrane protein